MLFTGVIPFQCHCAGCFVPLLPMQQYIRYQYKCSARKSDVVCIMYWFVSTKKKWSINFRWFLLPVKRYLNVYERVCFLFQCICVCKRERDGRNISNWKRRASFGFLFLFLRTFVIDDAGIAHFDSCENYHFALVCYIFLAISVHVR